MANDTLTAESIQRWLVSHLVEEIGIAAEEIDARAPFESYGLDSMIMVSLTGELEDWLGWQLSPNLLYEYTSIEALSQHLAQEAQEPPLNLGGDQGKWRTPGSMMVMTALHCHTTTGEETGHEHA